MPLNLPATHQHLQDFAFRRLFVEELGWNHPPHALKPADAEAKGGLRFHRAPVAVLSGIHVFEITTPGGAIPDAKARAAIHAAVSVLAAENLLIFTDAARTQSLWYWVKREAGKAHPRDHLYVKGQPADLFLSKLAALVVDIAELDAQGNIPLTEVARRLKDALDVERVTRKFFKDFDAQRLAFLEYLTDIADPHQRRWYASVLMNRLMFIYFLQRKFFLDGGNANYLADQLAASRQRGPDQFYSVFLRALFFEGFARAEAARSPETNRLLGRIRYLNGGLFLPHRVELDHGFPDAPRIRIPDVAFANLLALFQRYSWNLNDTPGGQADEINPDVLGYIFEKYINQKEFGAYYTRPEMTGYLCERTIHKLVLDRVNQAVVAADVSRRKSCAGDKSAPTHVGGYHSLSDLLLNLDAPVCRALVFDILPSLRLLDPACGSGAFLVAAMKVLINLYSAVLGKVELAFLGDPDLKRWHDDVHGARRAPAYYLKKRIITDNLFGVDIMEEATEIARLRLFLALVASAQTEDQLEPLPNIDFNILAGNSLIGLLHVDPKKFDSPSPAGAGEGGRRPGEGRGEASSTSAPGGGRGPGRQRMTLQHASDLGFNIETKTAPTRQEKTVAYLAQRNAAKFAAILEDKNRSIELYRKHAFAPVAQASSPASSAGVPARSSQRAARTPPEPAGEDACATDFSDLVDQDERVLRLREHIERVRADAYQRMNQLLLDEFQALGIQFEQATWDDQKRDSGKPRKRPLQLADIEALHPFHWGYEFDQVMAAGGFDAIITNPPWETFKPQAKEFFDDYSALVSKNKMTIKEFEKEQARLLKDPEIRAAWLEFLSRFPHVSLYFRNAVQFKNQISIVNGKKAGTDINLYKLFLEQCFNLLRDCGNCGVLVPTSIYTDLGAKQLRQMLFTQAEVFKVFGLSNERFIFEGVDHRFKFAIVSFAKGGCTDSFDAAFRLHPFEAIRPERLDGFLHDAADHVRIPVALVRRLSPDSLSVPEFRAPTDMRIAELMAEHPFLSEKLAETWNFVLRNEFHMTNDSHLFHAKPGPGRLPLFTGKMFNQFCLTEEHSGYWIMEVDGRKALLGRQHDAGAVLDYQQYRWVHRRIARNTDTRTLIATVTPRMVFTEVNSTVISLSESGISSSEMLYLTAITNSFCLDWFIRGRVSTTLNMFYLYQLPVPRLTAADAAFAPIVRRAAQLICTTPEFDALARELLPFYVGDDVRSLTAPASKKSVTPHVVSYKEIGVTDPAARAQLRAELDALIAHLYGLTEEEFAYILTTFPLVDAGIKAQTLAAYRAASPSRATSP